MYFWVSFSSVVFEHTFHLLYDFSQIGGVGPSGRVFGSTFCDFFKFVLIRQLPFPAKFVKETAFRFQSNPGVYVVDPNLVTLW